MSVDNSVHVPSNMRTIPTNQNITKPLNICPAK